MLITCIDFFFLYFSGLDGKIKQIKNEKRKILSQALEDIKNNSITVDDAHFLYDIPRALIRVKLDREKGQFLGFVKKNLEKLEASELKMS